MCVLMHFFMRSLQLILVEGPNRTAFPFGLVKRAFDAVGEKGGQQLFGQLQNIFDDRGEFDGDTLTIARGELVLVSATCR